MVVFKNTLMVAILSILALTFMAGRSIAGQYELRKMQQPMLLYDRHHSGNSPFAAPSRGEILWVASLPGGVVASPAVDAQGLSYWATLSGELIVLTPDGRPVWSAGLGGASHTSPALDRSGTVYVASRSGEISALSGDGRKLWTKETNREILSSPLLDEESRQLVLSVEDMTLGLDMDTGQLRFAYKVGNGKNNSSPTLGPDGLLRVVNWGGRAFSLSGQGKRVWSIELGGGGFWAAPTLGSFGTLYTAGQRDKVVAISPSGQMLWERRMGNGRSASAFLALTPGGQLLVPNFGRVVALGPDGQTLWQHDLKGDEVRTSLAVSSDGRILFGTVGGSVKAIDLSGDLVWEMTPVTNPRFASTVVIAAPVMGHSRAYIGARDGRVFCLY